jgi:hypothetical protein
MVRPPKEAPDTHASNLFGSTPPHQRPQWRSALERGGRRERCSSETTSTSQRTMSKAQCIGESSLSPLVEMKQNDLTSLLLLLE